MANEDDLTLWRGELDAWLHTQSVLRRLLYDLDDTSCIDPMGRVAELTSFLSRVTPFTPMREIVARLREFDDTYVLDGGNVQQAVTTAADQLDT
ncbi:MAG: hypothetical protein E6R03_08525 [Hyphomicrobiaceae bacterium]|nr:MAG: hypothetical protein E6R03_08525 [Hyphomicrobiaceae bacterium]